MMVKNHTRFPHECDIIAQTTGIKLRREGITKRKWKFMAFAIRRRTGLEMEVSVTVLKVSLGFFSVAGSHQTVFIDCYNL